jgi:hypothetical protein
MSRRTFVWAPLAAALFAVAIPGQARAEPGKAHRHGQQVVPTGAEDTPAAARKTAAEEEALADLERATSRSAEGLVEVLRVDGTVSVDLEGRFQNIAAVEDGRVSCETHGHGSAGAATRSAPSQALPGTAAARGAGILSLPPGAPVTRSPALEER